MKTQGFVKLLRKVIREEVRNVIKEELKPILNEGNVQQQNISLHEAMNSPEVPNQKIAKKQFTKNALLNDLLNETASTPSSQELVDYSSMNFKSEMAESFGTERQAPMRSGIPLASKGINGEVVNMQNEEVAKTVGAMTKDYSGMMKAMNKLDKQKGKK
tara:strand:+ start:3429 stop:3905 length:477 start_codon:yes stop_codon:yes gene_type:complete